MYGNVLVLKRKSTDELWICFFLFVFVGLVVFIKELFFRVLEFPVSIDDALRSIYILILKDRRYSFALFFFWSHQNNVVTDVVPRIIFMHQVSEIPRRVDLRLFFVVSG